MRDLLLVNWPLKALALVLAFAIWLSITGQDRTLRDFTVPLEIEFGPERIAAGAPPTGVSLRLEGPERTVRQLDPLRVAVRIDLRSAPLGEREIPLSSSHVKGVPRGVDVALFTPDRIRLVLVRRARRELEIAPELVGQPPDGHALYGVEVTPPTVVVEGPESAVDAMRGLRTEAIPLEGHADSFVAEVGLVPEDPQVQVIDADDVEVKVFVDVAPVESTFDDVPVVLPFDAERSARIRPPTVKVTFSGPPWLIERLEPTQISAVAEVSQPGPPRAERVPVAVDVRLGDDRKRLVKVISVRPTQVSVQVPD
jgi:YbbR domain-containing protein